MVNSITLVNVSFASAKERVEPKVEIVTET